MLNSHLPAHVVHHFPRRFRPLRVAPTTWTFSAAAAALLTVGCGSADAPPRPNVVLISIDSLRADHLGCYDYPEPTSPAMDELAAQGVLFTQASSSTSWTLPAHASMFTGLLGSAHACDGKVALAPQRTTLAETLRSEGYQTAGFWSGPYLHPVFGLDQGFDDYVNCATFDYGNASSPAEVADRSQKDITSPKLVEEAAAWLERRSDAAPFFLFVHMWDVHYDYIPPPPYDTMFGPDEYGAVDGSPPHGERPSPNDLQRLIALYDGEIAWTDKHVGMLMAKLRELGLEENTMVILTSDHGEEFFEHDRFGHRKQLFEESVAVPLIVRLPSRLPAGLRVRTPASVTDLVPTILATLDIDVPVQVLGRSLLPLMEAGSGDQETVVVSELLDVQGYLRAFRGPSWKAVYRVGQEAPLAWWNLSNDPGEMTNLLRLEAMPPEMERAIAETNRQVEASRARHDLGALPPLDLDEHVRDALEDLGYMGADE